MKFFSPKIIETRDADLHIHYANNAGRGSDNVTITVVKKGQARLSRTCEYNQYIDRFCTSGWKGSVNIKNELINACGGLVGEQS